MPRKKHDDRIFVIAPNGMTYCHDDIPASLKRRLGDADVDVWREYSTGWTGAPVCDICHLSLPVYIDADEDE